MQRSRSPKLFNDQEKLFLSLADGMNNTMLQLALLSERAVGSSGHDQTNEWRTVHDISRAALQLLESYTLTMRLQGGSAEPELEPIAVSSLMYDTAQLLEPYAKQLQVSVTIDMPSRLEPVISDRAILQAALLSLGHVFIAAQSEGDEPSGVIRLGAHKGRYGVVAGWYAKCNQLSARALGRARRLGGRVQQPYGELVGGSATGVFIADSLLTSLETKLHVARYHNATGLAATLPACRQLQLV